MEGLAEFTPEVLPDDEGAGQSRLNELCAVPVTPGPAVPPEAVLVLEGSEYAANMSRVSLPLPGAVGGRERGWGGYVALVVALVKLRPLEDMSAAWGCMNDEDEDGDVDVPEEKKELWAYCGPP